MQGLNPDCMGTMRWSRLRWNIARIGDLPSTWFLVHPTAMVHPMLCPPNQSRGILVNLIVSTKRVGIYGLALEGDMCWSACGCLFKVFTFEKEAGFFKGPSTSWAVHFIISYRNRLTLRSNTLIHVGGNIGVISLLIVKFETCVFVLNIFAFQGVHFWKEAIIFKILLILVLPVSRLHMELD